MQREPCRGVSLVQLRLCSLEMSQRHRTVHIIKKCYLIKTSMASPPRWRCVAVPSLFGNLYLARRVQSKPDQCAQQCRRPLNSTPGIMPSLAGPRCLGSMSWISKAFMFSMPVDASSRRLRNRDGPRRHHGTNPGPTALLLMLDRGQRAATLPVTIYQNIDMSTDY